MQVSRLVFVYCWEADILKIASRVKGFVSILAKDPALGLRRLGYEFYRFRHPNEPWISQGAIAFCEAHLNSKMDVFEWGSGSSTTWFSKRVNSVTSVEYSQPWYERVKQTIAAENIKNVSLILSPLEHPKSDPTPLHYDSLPKYVDLINNYPDESFDLVVIDGHYRWTCAYHCFNKVKAGGYLMIDNSNRSLEAAWNIPEGWKKVHESENPVTQTTIWQK